MFKKYFILSKVLTFRLYNIMNTTLDIIFQHFRSTRGCFGFLVTFGKLASSGC